MMNSRFQEQIDERKYLIEQANYLIEKFSLPVPRFVSSRFINYQFWAFVFNRIFLIKCNVTLNTQFERIEMIKSCLNTLESLIGISLDHIKPAELLHYDISTMKNLLEIARVWGENINSSVNNENNCLDDIDTCLELNSKQQTSLNHTTKSVELANLLYKSLKTQALANEIDKKIKIYLGDVTVRSQTNPDYDKIRSSRKSTVRTRAIQPLTTFNFNMNRAPKRNPILSAYLDKLFPEIPNELMELIKEQEQHLFILEKNVRSWQESQTNRQIGQALNEAIEKQRKRVELAEKEAYSDEINKKRTKLLRRTNPLQSALRETRAQRASLQNKINQFYNHSTAAYLNSRSHLEQILAEEFSKVEANKRKDISEIRKYLRNHYDVEADKVRTLLAKIDELFAM